MVGGLAVNCHTEVAKMFFFFEAVASINIITGGISGQMNSTCLVYTTQAVEQSV